MLVRQSAVGSLTLAGVFPSMGYRKLRRASTEVLAGFYANGEISSFIESTACNLHTQTMTITYISEP